MRCMRLHRFYTPLILGKTLIIENTTLLHQWKNVFRYSTGDQVILFDGMGQENTYTIDTISKKEAELTCIREGKSKMQKKNNTLAFSLIKKDNVELILQKCTEIGITHFAPLITERSEKKSLNIERAQKILVEAVEQSGWGKVPTITDPILLEKFLEDTTRHIYVLDQDGTPLERGVVDNVTICIGPEGGWGERDRELFNTNNCPTRSLGEGTLRAETAAIVASAFVTQ